MTDSEFKQPDRFRKMTCKYIVFLDIDGVFTSTRAQYASANQYDLWNIFDPVAISFMNKIHDRVDGVYFALVSTWKNYLRTDDHMIEHWMTSSFRNAGFRGEFWSPWKTNPDNFTKFKTRAYEAKDYMETFTPDLKDFIVFDDNDYNWEQVFGKKRWIRTDAENGMLMKHMKDAMSIIGHWDEKKS